MKGEGNILTAKSGVCNSNPALKVELGSRNSKTALRA